MADFKKAQTTFDQMWTFTRASEATYFDDAGILQTAGNDVARETSQGLLMEAASTNELPQSQNFVTAEWNGVGSPTRSMNEVGIDGQANTAGTLSDNSTTYTAFYNDEVTVPDDSNPAVASIFIKKTTGQAHAAGVNLLYLNGTTTIEAKYFFDTNNGTFTQASDSPDALDSHSAELIGNFWRLNLVLSNNSTGNTTLSIRIYPAIGLNGVNVPDLTITGSNIFAQAQIELNRTKASTPIITAGAAGTRADDVCRDNSVDWSGAPDISLIIEIAENYSTVSSAIISLNDVTATDRLLIYNKLSGDIAFFIDSDGFPPNEILKPPFSSGKIALSFDSKSKLFRVCSNGDYGSVTHQGDPLQFTRMYLKELYDQSTKGELLLISCIKIFPYAMTEQELIELTT